MRRERAIGLALLASLVLALALVPIAATAGGDSKRSGEAGGESYGAQIHRGTPDRQPDVQWVSAILRRGPGSRFSRQFCGGSLVAKRYVLTAAHCVVDGRGATPARTLQVLVGTKHLNRGGQTIGVARVGVFPGYNERTSYGDMALLRLRRPARYAPAALVSAGTHYVGSGGYIAGWGNRASVDSGRNDFPMYLHSAFIPIVADGECIEGDGLRDLNYDGSVMLCAGFESGAPDTCAGDSGGPLARRVDGRWRIVGVTSYGRPGCGSFGTYGVYSWVGSEILRGWLRNRLGS